MEDQFGRTDAKAIGWRLLTADCVAVWGGSSKKAMLKQSNPEERFIIKGSPGNDSLINWLNRK